jgi:hypothetical protein
MLRSHASRIELLEDSQQSAVTELTALANRVKMQRVRAATDHASRPAGDPDPYTNPDEWRSVMNKRLAAAKLNGGRQ